MSYIRPEDLLHQVSTITMKDESSMKGDHSQDKQRVRIERRKLQFTDVRGGINKFGVTEITVNDP